LFFQAEDGIRGGLGSRGLGDVEKRQRHRERAVRAKKGMILIVMANGRGQLMAEMVSTRDSAEISRSTILERLARNNPRLVSLVAPAGFGKTTLALQIARSAGMHVVCDCSGIESDMELAVRVVAALANESTGDDVGSLIQCQLALQSPDVSIESRTSLVIDAWRNATRQAVFIFDNAEDLIGKRSAIRLLSRLLSALPHQRQGRRVLGVPVPLRLRCGRTGSRGHRYRKERRGCDCGRHVNGVPRGLGARLCRDAGQRRI